MRLEISRVKHHLIRGLGKQMPLQKASSETLARIGGFFQHSWEMSYKDLVLGQLACNGIYTLAISRSQLGLISFTFCSHFYET